MSSPLPAINERYTQSCFRLETLQDYAGISTEEQQRVAWWRGGAPRYRSLRDQDGYLRRVAAHTMAGKRRSRVHVVTFPLAEYIHYELDAYRENIAVGESVHITDAGDVPTPLGPDFWLFDGGTVRAEAVILHYDTVTAEVLNFEHLTRAGAPRRLDELEEQATVALRASRTLQQFVAELAGLDELEGSGAKNARRAG